MPTRRDFLGACCIAALVPQAARAAAPPGKVRVLWLMRQGTLEETRLPFCTDGQHVYMPGYRALCWLLRDRQVSPSIGYVPFSIDTIEALWEVQQTLAMRGIARPIIITSGYRSPKSNANTDNAVQNSQHLHATAVDMYVEGVSMAYLFNACYSRAISGGIGYYASHVHLDTGPRRYWMGAAGT